MALSYGRSVCRDFRRPVPDLVRRVMTKQFSLPRLRRLPVSVGMVLSVFMAFSLAGCASKPEEKEKPRGFSPSVYGVSASKKVVEKGQPVPVGGGVYSMGKPYKVKGKWYHPKHDPNYDETGVASWYGDDFHGRRTSNGEVYNMYALSAAHKTLPLPSYVRVTNPKNGRSIVVRVNDRGPFHGNRVIDLSKRTANVLQIAGSGIGNVRIQYVGPAKLDGNDQWLETTYRQDGRAMSPTQLAEHAPVPDWARPQQSAPSAVQMALAPVPLERPRDVQPSQQLASLAPMAPSAPVIQPVSAPVAANAAAPSMPNSLTPMAYTTPQPRPVTGNIGIPVPLAKPTVGAANQVSGQQGRHLHVGSFRDPQQAMRYRDGLARHGTSIVEPVNVSGITFYQVRVGPFRDTSAAEAAMRDAQSQGASSARISSL